jgi:hypothetical protein
MTISRYSFARWTKRGPKRNGQKRHMARTSPNTAARRTDLAQYLTVHTHDIAFNSPILKSRAL